MPVITLSRGRFPTNCNPGPSLNPPEDLTRYRCAVCRERYLSDEIKGTLTADPDEDRLICDYCHAEREREQ